MYIFGIINNNKVGSLDSSDLNSSKEQRMGLLVSQTHETDKAFQMLNLDIFGHKEQSL